VQGAKGLRTTAKGTDVFVHLFDWPGTELVVSAERLPKFASASLLDGGQALEFQQQEGRVTIQLPPQATDSDVTVIRLRG
jgi:alpha-L-fucosidase